MSAELLEVLKLRIFEWQDRKNHPAIPPERDDESDDEDYIPENEGEESDEVEEDEDLEDRKEDMESSKEDD